MAFARFRPEYGTGLQANLYFNGFGAIHRRKL